MAGRIWSRIVRIPSIGTMAHQ
ncbi:hypothetical protein CKAH01_17320 [Colletotrichum kahawae]|uniref:Uncharacterized protein n=1 Tax=Colletotrichum kahawae TaxID=34407 RepID=A0AAE0D726_COLKA|nr:hypothetical protein CKAH01_17320 [Colletotrichum kahawae]